MKKKHGGMQENLEQLSAFLLSLPPAKCMLRFSQRSSNTDDCIFKQIERFSMT